MFDVVIVSLDIVAGVAFLVVGALARTHEPRYAALAVAAGVVWFAGDLAPAVALAHRPLQLWTVLSFPGGTLRSRRDGVLVALVALAALLPAGGAGDLGFLGLAVAAVTTGVLDLRSATGPARADAAVSLRATVVLALSWALPATARLLGASPGSESLLLLGYELLVTAAGLVLVLGVIQHPGRAADAAIDLTSASPATTLAALRGELLRAGSSTEPAVRSAIELLAAHESLTSDVARRVEDVRASRQRLLETSDLERERLGRRLERGALRRLDELDGSLRECVSLGDEATRVQASRCREEVEHAREDLHRLAAGLRPRSLAEQGLVAALHELADGSPVPTRVTTPSGPIPPHLEATLWYVCAEAVANLGKYSQARSARIDVCVDEPDVVARVCDDGVGGASVQPGGGLSGLRERVGAVAGTLRVTSEPGSGTEVEARVPWH